MGSNTGVMIKLQPNFQKTIFRKLIEKYGGSIKAGKNLNLVASSIRGYKNLYFDSVPEMVLNQLIKLNITNKRELNKKTLEIFEKSEKVAEQLSKGREKRKEQFKKMKRDIPPLKHITKGTYLDFKEWFDKYKFLVNSNFRKLNIKERKEYIVAKYENFTKKGFKHFEVKLPSKILLDDEFIYFLGLWCGDRAGGKRFGVCNQNEKIINFVENFLNKNYQNVEKILYMKKGLIEPKLIYDKKFLIDKDINGWVLSTHSNNGILASFFHYIQSDLEDFLALNKNNCAFFAGLFDAEGNVSLYNKSFRWACHDKEMIKIYSKFLKRLNLYDGYDGNCMISYNKREFYDKILPYMKHSDKINLTKLMITGKGNLPRKYISVLDKISNSSNLTAKEVAKALKETKVYSELRLLKDFGFITSTNYPNKYKITNKGNKTLGRIKL